jgi:hypothetical protein
LKPIIFNACRPVHIHISPALSWHGRGGTLNVGLGCHKGS